MDFHDGPIQISQYRFRAPKEQLTYRSQLDIASSLHEQPYSEFFL
jgi:hypothetical protein